MDPVKVKLHEEFVQNLNGTSVSEIFWLLTPCPMYIFNAIFSRILVEECWESFVNCKSKTGKLVNGSRSLMVFIREMSFVTIPMLMTPTCFVDVGSSTILAAVLLANILIFLVFRDMKLAPLLEDSSSKMYDLLNLQIKDEKRSFITCWRSLSIMLAVIGVLAVDFRIFPRRLAKTESYGFSLMDLGVGYFVISNSIVVTMEKIAKTSYYQNHIGSAVLFLLGLCRYFFIQRINYQTHASEYGLHWNFFFTIALVRMLTFTILKTFKQPLFSAILIGLLHQMILSSGVEEYVMGNTPRDNWMDANREGIFSLLGYTSLYLFGVALNEVALKNSKTVDCDLKAIIKLIHGSILFFLITDLLKDAHPATRRLVNLTYISWTMAMILHHLAGLLAVELFFRCFCARDKHKSYRFLTPSVCESINFNGLPFFLLANLLTGFINIFFNTLEMNDIHSYIVLILYMTINCGVVYVLYLWRIRLKFW